MRNLKYKNNSVPLYALSRQVGTSVVKKKQHTTENTEKTDEKE